MYNILLIGDSLTYLGLDNGWGAYLKNWYQNKVDIIDKSICKYTSNMIKENLNELINIKNYSICSILLGTIDCYNSNCHCSPDEYKNNINYIIDYLWKINPHCYILLITPPLCSLNKDILLYVNELYKIVEENKHIILVDLYKGHNNIELYDLSVDGLHLNNSGNWKVYCKIKEAIEKHLPCFHPNRL
jgi:lysophospholipase L1-like esterase